MNASNDGLWAGGGICGAIFFCGRKMKKLRDACGEIGHFDTSSAVSTPGFDLKARYIIHAVGPRWKYGKHGESKLLYGAYRKSLELAAAHGCWPSAPPLISAGIFGDPV